MSTPPAYEQIDWDVRRAEHGFWLTSETRLRQREQDEEGEHGEIHEWHSESDATDFAVREAKAAIESGRAASATVFLDGSELACFDSIPRVADHCEAT